MTFRSVSYKCVNGFWKATAARLMLSLLLVTVMAPPTRASSQSPAVSKKPIATASRPLLRLKAGEFDLAAPLAMATLNAAPASGQLGLFVVQFKTVITDGSWAVLKAAGAEVDSYLPDFAFLVRMKPEQAQRITSSDLVNAVLPYRSSWKLGKGLTDTADDAFYVTTFSGEQANVAKAVERLGGQAVVTEGGVVATGLNTTTLQALTKLNSVTYVDAKEDFKLNNDQARQIMQVVPSGAPWPISLTGTGQVIAVADTGLDTGNLSTLHPDLRNQLKGTPFALGRSNNWSDPMGHGTHVAGSVLGNGSASNGKYKGVAPGAKLVFQSVLDSKGGLGGLPNDLSVLFSQAANAGAKIHSNSWGANTGSSYTTTSRQVDDYLWKHKDFTVLFSAGNKGADYPYYYTIGSPATAKNAITVGASENLRPELNRYWADNPNEVAEFSSRGPTLDGRLKPDVVAPGTWILSTRSQLADPAVFNDIYDSRYAYMSGTSMATPLTAGAVALIRQYYTDVQHINPAASLIKASLINGATLMDNGWMSNSSGWGRVDVSNSLFPKNNRTNWFANEGAGLTTNAMRSYSFGVKSSQPLKITLVWTDYPGAVASARELVNDLDLWVTDPLGRTYAGNCIGGDSSSTDCRWADGENNVESANFPSPMPGRYTVLVKGYNVPQGPQPYSLVVSGALDSQAPTISLTSPVKNATVRGMVTATAVASDNDQVDRVEFYLDNQIQAPNNSNPNQWDWQTWNVPDGLHTLVAKAFDPVGNYGASTPLTVTVANRPVFIQTPVADSTVHGSLDVTISPWAEEYSHVDFFVDDVLKFKATSQPFKWPWSTIGVAAGPHTLKVQTYYGVSVASTATTTVTVDNQAPTISLTSPANLAIISKTTTVKASASDNIGVAKVEFYVDNTLKSTATQSPYTWDWDTTGVATGNHTVMAKASDTAGNTTSTSLTVKVDNQTPFVSITAPKSGATVAGSLTVTASATDETGLSKVEFYRNGQLQSTVTTGDRRWTWDTKKVGDGTYTLSAKAYDKGGNVGTATDILVTVDNTPPTISITAPGGGQYVRGEVPVTVNAADIRGVSKVEFFVDNVFKGTVSQAPYTWKWQTATEVKSHTLTAKVYDAAGNTMTSSAITVIVDNRAPSVVMTPRSFAGGGMTKLEATASDTGAMAKVEFYLDETLLGADSNSPYTFDWDATVVPEGVYILKAKAYDVAGNTTTTAPISVKVERQAPSVDITAPVNSAVLSGEVKVTVSATDSSGIGKVEFYLDGTLRNTVTSSGRSWSWNTRQTKNGSHRLVVRAYDLAGNQTSKEVNVTVSNALPLVTLTAPIAGTTLRGSITVGATASSSSSSVAKVEFYLDGKLQSTVTSSLRRWTWDTSKVEDGTHTLSAMAYDPAGNVGTTADISVTVDNTPPSISITDPIVGKHVRGEISVTANAVDNLGVSKVEFFVDGVSKGTVTQAPYTWTWRTATAGNRSHTLTAMVYDAAGNTTTSSAVSVTVDNQAPLARMTSPANLSFVGGGTTKLGATTFDNVAIAQVEFYLDDTLLGIASFSPYTFDWNLTGVAEGLHKLKAKAYDRAGNVGESIAVSVKVSI